MVQKVSCNSTSNVMNALGGLFYIYIYIYVPMRMVFNNYLNEFNPELNFINDS
jgi:hypothetical protein